MLVIVLLIIIAFVWLVVRAMKSASGAPASPQRREISANAMTYANPDQLSSVARSANRTPARWVTPGEPTEIAGISIPGGMIYVGGALPSSRGYGDENCLVDPALLVSHTGSDRAGDTMTYWPSYSSIQPSARRAYLEWLAGGRQDPDAGIGFVFLFFYGLERRLFIDNSRAEAPLLLDEVRRLLTIYGGNGSLSGYAKRFLEAGALLTHPSPPPPHPSPEMRNGYEVPLDVRMHLGRLVAAGAPLRADDAFIWVLSLPDTYLRVPAVRCFAELHALWRPRFEARYPEGLRVREPKARLKANYRAASGTFECAIPIGDLPDVSAIAAPLAGLREVLGACTEDLEGYSRLLGRRPEARGTTEAAALLPSELAESEFGAALRALRNALEAHFNGDQLSTMHLSELLSLLGIDAPVDAKLPTPVARQIGATLDRFDIGYEPDRRYGPNGPTADGAVVIFKASKGAYVDCDRAEYTTARTMVEVAALAAIADGVVDPSEFEAIRADLRGMVGLAVVDQVRLMAYTLALLKDPPKQQAALNRLEKLSASERAQVIKSAMSAVLADGRVTPSEIKFLERIHKTLGLPQDDVYAALHRGTVRVDEPVVVADPQWTKGVPIPAEPQEAATIMFDMSRLERVRAQTSEVSKLLAGIFVEEDVLTSPASRPAPALPGASAFKGLDIAHANLLSAILATNGLEHAEYEQRARALRLLPDGAMETINEWAFDVFDEPVLEGDDVIGVVGQLRDQLQQMRVSA